jgi:PadR family transcriptional regulator PadR
MRRSDLGEFEEVVLPAVSPNAYTAAIAEELEEETGNAVISGAVHAAMQRLGQKGNLRFVWGRSNGGKRRKAKAVVRCHRAWQAHSGRGKGILQPTVERDFACDTP